VNDYWQILGMLSDATIAVRTKALKCLASVIEVDPAVLAWVSCRDFCLCMKNITARDRLLHFAGF